MKWPNTFLGGVGRDVHHGMVCSEIYYECVLKTHCNPCIMLHKTCQDCYYLYFSDGRCGSFGMYKMKQVPVVKFLIIQHYI